jgi:hypothetical protein
MLRARDQRLAHVNNWGAEWMSRYIVPRPKLDRQSHTCLICSFNHVLGALGNHHQVVFDLPFHNASAGHQANVAPNAAVDRVAMLRALGWPLQRPNPPSHTVVARCYVCGLDPQGLPRVEFGSIGRNELAAHLNGQQHARRLTDGRLLAYDLRHQAANNIGILPGELW